MKEVRTRFAPSPTGALHVGTVRTALFAWLLAKHDQGKFILRIEDTDQSRSTKTAEKNILESLKYLKIDWDEGPDKGGKYGPYVQSQRLDIYKDWAQKLYKAGRAYADPYTPAELDKFREDAKAAKKPFLYRDHRPPNPPEWDGKKPLRFRSEPKKYTWDDAVMGEMHSSEEAIDDFILIKSDGFPTYNFAHIIDDHLMDISHVTRSQEFISSTPRFLNLYEALGIKPPILVTFPLVVGEDGRKKLSKREGAKQILEYKEMGILPEAMVNCLATIGWNDGSEQEFFSISEIIDKFDLSRIQKGKAQFDEHRLLWLNGQSIRKLTLGKLYEQVSKYWPKEAEDTSETYKKAVLSLIHDRLKYFAELPELSIFFFKDLKINRDLITSTNKLNNLSHEELADLLAQSRESLEGSDFSLKDITKRLNELLIQTKQPPAILFSLIRIATTQAPASPELDKTLAVLGKETVLRRIDQTIKSLS